MKRFGYFLIVFAVLFGVASLPARADTISFNSNTAIGSSWNLAGSPLGLSLSSALTSVQLDLFAPNTSILSGAINIATGSVSSATSSLMIFNPGGSITVTGDLGSGIVNLFTGSFQNASLTLLTGGAPGQSAFSASFIAGSINPALYSFLGQPGVSPSVTGTLSATMNGTFGLTGGSGTVAGSTISLVATPEPSTLALFGSGLLALGLLIATTRSARPVLRS